MLPCSEARRGGFVHKMGQDCRKNFCKGKRMRNCSFGVRRMSLGWSGRLKILSTERSLLLDSAQAQGSCGRHMAEELQPESCINTCGCCSFGGRSVDTVEVTPLVGSRGSVFSKHLQKGCYLGQVSQQGPLPQATVGRDFGRGEVLLVCKGTLEVSLENWQNMPRHFVVSLRELDFLQIMWELSHNNIFV